MPNANMRMVNEDRLTDLEKLANYFEGQSWDESWPADVILALARVAYPELAPFKLVVDDELVDEQDATEIGALFYMMDVRDKDGQPLPRTRNQHG